MSERPSPTDVVARLRGNYLEARDADAIIAALEAAGYRIVPQTALDVLEQEARAGHCSYHFGWIVGWLDRYAPDQEHA